MFNFSVLQLSDSSLETVFVWWLVFFNFCWSLFSFLLFFSLLFGCHTGNDLHFLINWCCFFLGMSASLFVWSECAIFASSTNTFAIFIKDFFLVLNWLLHRLSLQSLLKSVSFLRACHSASGLSRLLIIVLVVIWARATVFTLINRFLLFLKVMCISADLRFRFRFLRLRLLSCCTNLFTLFVDFYDFLVNILFVLLESLGQLCHQCWFLGSLTIFCGSLLLISTFVRFDWSRILADLFLSYFLLSRWAVLALVWAGCLLSHFE